MKNTLIITIGTRDIYVDEKVLNGSFTVEVLKNCLDKNNRPFARLLGELLLTKINSLKKQITLPIIQPAIDYIKRHSSNISKVWLIVTDQEKGVGERFYYNDSINYGKIVKQILGDQLQNPDGTKPSFSLISVKENITFLDSMYDEFSKSTLMKTLQAEIDETNKVFLLNQGGIDAVNTALLFHTIKIAQGKVAHLSVDEKSNQCIHLNFSEKFIEESEIEKAKAFIRNYDYSALNVLPLVTDVKNIAAYAQARLQFDFTKANQYLEVLGIKHRTFMVSQKQELQKIQQGEGGLIKELYFNARIKWLQHSYVDFLLRFFRIVEYTVQFKACRYINIQSFNKDRWGSDLDIYFDNDENGKFLQDKLNNEIVNGKQLDYYYPSISTYLAIIKNFNDPDFDFLKKLQTLSNLRNKSIGAHDFQPVSFDIIREKLLENRLTVDEMFSKLDVFFKLDFAFHNPFIAINKELTSLL
ncbi:hypothetical protein [Parafilimonas sp.]|uniref:hypothetical protein n=1 Tax=Parafilimonas sp. TaxID=1969739 RepID=UPI0039E29E33